jgi:hypothetical protein
MEQFLSMTRACRYGVVCALVAGCGAVQTPEFLKGAGSAQDHPEHPAAATNTQAAGQDSGLHPKEIKKLAPMASVMLEKNCPNIVQPFRLTDNAASLARFGADGMLAGLGNSLNGLLVGGTRTAQQGKIAASTKLAAKQLNWLPMEVETMYGDRSHRQETNLLDRDSKAGKRYYPVADRMLREVLAQIGQTHNYNFKLFIEKTSSHNALSRPGGYLYLDQGLFERPAGYPRAYFALAHEVSHVLQRHETMELQSMIIDSFTLQEDMQKTISSAAASPEAVLAHVKIGKNQFIRHHIDQELQADSCAARILSRVLPERQELAGSLNAFLKELPKPVAAAPDAAPTTEAEKLAATVHDLVEKPIKVHPTSIEREQNLRAMYVEVTQAKGSSRP